MVKVEEERTPTCKHSKNISSDFIPPPRLEVECGPLIGWFPSQVWNLPYWIFAPVKIGCPLIIGNSLQSDDIIILVCVCVCVCVRTHVCVPLQNPATHFHKFLQPLNGTLQLNWIFPARVWGVESGGVTASFPGHCHRLQYDWAGAWEWGQLGNVPCQYRSQ